MRTQGTRPIPTRSGHGNAIVSMPHRMVQYRLRWVGIAFCVLCLAPTAPAGCAREEDRSPAEACTGNSEFPNKECPSAEAYHAKYLSPPPCNQDPGDCRAENVRGPTLKSDVSITDGCCYTYTHVQKPDPIF